MTYIPGARPRKKPRGSKPRKLNPKSIGTEQLSNLAGYFANRLKHQQQMALEAKVEGDEVEEKYALNLLAFYMGQYKKCSDELETREHT